MTTDPLTLRAQSVLDDHKRLLHKDSPDDLSWGHYTYAVETVRLLFAERERLLKEIRFIAGVGERLLALNPDHGVNWRTAYIDATSAARAALEQS